MHARIRSLTGRPFRRAGITFPPAGIDVDLASLSAEQRAAIEAESILGIEPIDQTQRPDGEQQQGSAAATGTAEGAAPDDAPVAEAGEPSLAAAPPAAQPKPGKKRA